MDFVGEDKKGNRIKMVEISFLSNDSVILEQFLSLALSGCQMFLTVMVLLRHHNCFFFLIPFVGI